MFGRRGGTGGVAIGRCAGVGGGVGLDSSAATGVVGGTVVLEVTGMLVPTGLAVLLPWMVGRWQLGHISWSLK